MWLSTVKNRDLDATLSFELATVLHQHEPHLSHGEDRNHQSCFLTEIFTKHMAILCTLQPEMELSTVERILLQHMMMQWHQHNGCSISIRT